MRSFFLVRTEALIDLYSLIAIRMPLKSFLRFFTAHLEQFRTDFLALFEDSESCKWIDRDSEFMIRCRCENAVDQLSISTNYLLEPLSLWYRFLNRNWFNQPDRFSKFRDASLTALYSLPFLLSFMTRKGRQQSCETISLAISRALSIDQLLTMCCRIHRHKLIALEQGCIERHQGPLGLRCCPWRERIEA